MGSCGPLRGSAGGRHPPGDTWRHSDCHTWERGMLLASSGQRRGCCSSPSYGQDAPPGEISQPKTSAGEFPPWLNSNKLD